jgi:hypothetical protein
MKKKNNMDFTQIKEWLKRFNDKQKDIDIIINDRLREKEELYKAWEKALNELIDKHRSEDGYAYMKYRNGRVYVAAEKADVYIVPSISGMLYTDLAHKGVIHGINCINRQRGKKEINLISSIIKITDDIEFVTKEEFINVYNKIKNQNE